MEDNNALLDRAFDEIDTQGKRIEDLAKVVYTQASIVGILSKIVFGLVIAALLSLGGMVVDHLKSANQNIKEKAAVEEVIKTTIEEYTKKTGVRKP